MLVAVGYTFLLGQNIAFLHNINSEDELYRFPLAWRQVLIGVTRKELSLRTPSKILKNCSLVSLPKLRLLLTHLRLASHKRDICKQCRPRSDAAERAASDQGLHCLH